MTMQIHVAGVASMTDRTTTATMKGFFRFACHFRLAI